MSINPTSNPQAANLLAQVKKIRSFYADPVEKLGKERSDLSRASYNTREQADSFSSQVRTLGQAKASLKALAQIWSAGQLASLQDTAAETAARAAGNPFASIALNVRQGLAGVIGDKRSETEDAVEGAAVLAGPMGNDPAHYADNLNDALAQNFYKLPGDKWLEGEVNPAKLGQTANLMETHSQVLGRQAEGLYQQASDQWKTVDNVQDQLNTQFKARRDPAVLAQKIELTKALVADLDAEFKQNPQICRQIVQADKDQGGTGRFLATDGLLASYHSQLAKNGGDPDKVNWAKLSGSLDSTSFG